jgi:magnesium-transporting ATPase (P-type)
VAAGQVNTAPPGPGRTVGQILRANVLTRFNAILGTLFVVVVVVGPPQDALFGIVLVVNTGFGVFQELRAKRTLDRLAILTAARARVVREGVTAEIPVDQVVIDDVLELRQGDQIPVDGAVLGAEGLEADEALLTGEAEPVAKPPGAQVLSGSFVVAGTGRVRATGVGAQAYAARLQAQARRFSLIRSELQQGTNQILRLVTWVMIPAGLLVVISEFFRSHEPLEDAVRGSAAAVVAMVPEGLVLLTSLAFTAGALRLARRRVLVQELAAVEGLAEELRDDTAATVRYLLGQGVSIKVLSGDAPRAVAAIAERAGIPVTGTPCDASALSDDAVAAALASASVLGRVRPGHKLAAVGLWVLALIAGLPALMRVALVTAMAGALVLLLAIPLARRVFALPLPPASVCAWVACVTAAAIAGLTVWTRWRGRPGADEPDRDAAGGIRDGREQTPMLPSADAAIAVRG